ATDEGVRVLAEEGDVAAGDDLGDDLVDQRRLAAALLAIKQVAAAVQKAVLAEARAERPERVDLVQDLRRQAAGEVDQVIDLEVAGVEVSVAVTIEDGGISAGRQLWDRLAAGLVG